MRKFIVSKDGKVRGLIITTEAVARKLRKEGFEVLPA